MIYILGPKDKKLSKDIPVINVTTSSKTWSKYLSPMLLGPVELYKGIWSKNVENAWQYSKVYKGQMNKFGEPGYNWFTWAERGFNDVYAHRYPMGKGAIPEYSYWDGYSLDYIEARKIIYLPLYRTAVLNSKYYSKLLEIHNTNKDIALWDFDGYNHIKLGMTLDDVLNDPSRKMGHAFVLAMILEGMI